MRTINRIQLELKELFLQIKSFKLQKKLIDINQLIDSTPSASLLPTLTSIQQGLEYDIKRLQELRKETAERIARLKIDKLVKKYLK